MEAQTLSQLIAEHERFPQVLAALLKPQPAERLREREAEGRWSPLEILVHLRDEEREDFRARAQAAAAGAESIAGIDPVGWVAARRYNEQDPVEVLAELTRERTASCEWLRGLRPEQLTSKPNHPRLGDLSCADFVAAWRMHDLLHLRQLATTLARLEARRLADHAVGYAGDIP